MGKNASNLIIFVLIIICAIVILATFLYWPQLTHKSQNDVGQNEVVANYTSTCDVLSQVKSLTINNGMVQLEFSPSFAIGYGNKISSVNNSDLNSDGQNYFEQGEGFSWTDRDHASVNLMFDKIIGEQAYITVSDEFNWLGQTELTVKKCFVDKYYQAQDY